MIKRQKEIFIINECSAIFDKDELKQAILWKTELPVLSTKRVFMYGNYPAISIYDKKIHIHRLLMEYWLNARIPKEFAVHHLNENKLDARKENLAVILHSVHISSHNKGKKPAESTIKATIESNKRRKGTHYKNIHENKELLEGGK